MEQALRSGEPVAVQNALLKWGNSVCSDDPPLGLEQIGERILELKKVSNLLIPLSMEIIKTEIHWKS